jgi:hypothetical protein
MVWFIAAFVWMNIGIAWAFHSGSADFGDEVEEKIYVQIHMILWPLSVAVFVFLTLRANARRAALKAKLKAKISKLAEWGDE